MWHFILRYRTTLLTYQVVPVSDVDSRCTSIYLSDITRYYRVVTWCYNEIHIRMMPHKHFTIQVGRPTMSTGKHPDADYLQTQDCLLLWNVDVYL